MLWKWVAGGVGVTLLAVGLGVGAAVWISQPDQIPTAPHQADMGSQPEWFTQAPERVREVYQWAAANEPILAYIPCYCGCISAGHKNNYECYFRQGVNGKEYDQHAFG